MNHPLEIPTNSLIPSHHLPVRAFAVWLGLFAAAFANGALREVIIKQFLSEPGAHQISAATGGAMMTLVVWLAWRWLAIPSPRAAAAVGLVWFILTALTETFLLNRWTSGLSWEQIAKTYDLWAGELWPLVLLWIGILPNVIFSILKTRAIIGSPR
jgi:hypothetical protein